MEQRSGIRSGGRKTRKNTEDTEASQRLTEKADSVKPLCTFVPLCVFCVFLALRLTYFVGMTKRVIDCAGKLCERLLAVEPLGGGVSVTLGSATIAFRLALL